MNAKAKALLAASQRRNGRNVLTPSQAQELAELTSQTQPEEGLTIEAQATLKAMCLQMSIPKALDWFNQEPVYSLLHAYVMADLNYLFITGQLELNSQAFRKLYAEKLQSLEAS